MSISDRLKELEKRNALSPAVPPVVVDRVPEPETKTDVEIYPHLIFFSPNDDYLDTNDCHGYGFYLVFTSYSDDVSHNSVFDTDEQTLLYGPIFLGTDIQDVKMKASDLVDCLLPKLKEIFENYEDDEDMYENMPSSICNILFEDGV